MLALVLFLMGATWALKSVVGKGLVLVVGLLLLSFASAVGSTGGTVWIMCLILVLLSGVGLYRRLS